MTSALPAIKGFDRQGEPELRAGDNGGLELVFNFMPPATASGEERAPELFEKFETVLAQVLGVRVLRDDRETFIIAAPKPGTAERSLPIFLISGRPTPSFSKPRFRLHLVCPTRHSRPRRRFTPLLWTGLPHRSPSTASRRLENRNTATRTLSTFAENH